MRADPPGRHSRRTVAALTTAYGRAARWLAVAWYRAALAVAYGRTARRPAVARHHAGRNPVLAGLAAAGSRFAASARRIPAAGAALRLPTGATTARTTGVAVLATTLVLAAAYSCGRPSPGTQWLAPVAADGQVPAGQSRSAAASTPAAVRSPAGSPSRPARPSGTPSPRQSRSPQSPAPRPSVGPAGTTRSTGDSSVALTFDDGPDPVNTPRMLDTLRRSNVKATFCVVGWRARDHPDLVRRIAAEGHTLCNHSWQHLTDLAARPVSYIRWDLAETNRVIRNAVPGAKISYFRAPGGNFSADLISLAREFGMKSIYWDVDPRDWDHTADKSAAAHTERIVTSVERDTRAGSIVLSHDNRQPGTVAAYEVLLPRLAARFKLVALPA